MTKKQFYSDPDVQEMACWVAKRFDDKSGWTHSFQHKRPKCDWACTGLRDACCNYIWKKKNLNWKETKKKLNTFRHDLREACETGNETRVISVCEQILKWGGVINGNKNYLKCRQGSMVPELQHMKGLLSNDETPSRQDMRPLSGDPCKKYPEYQMNAGFSKIYSLLCDYCVMYDSRVGAALSLLARQFCKVKGYEQVPCKLEFRPPQHQTQHIRNASCGNLKFRTLWRSPLLYTEQVMCASWFLCLVLEKEPNVFSKGEEGFHELAAGLFMVGYDLENT